MMWRLQYILPFLILVSQGRSVLGSVIVNGNKVPDDAMQYMASVQNIFGHVCGGFLVSEDFVLTAAHCLDDNLSSVVLGDHNLNHVNTGQRINIEKKIRHPFYENVGLGDDLMLLKLSQKAELGNGVEIIKLPDPNMNVEVNERCQVAGWGATHTNGVNVNELMATDVSIIDIKTCRDQWTVIPHDVICAGGSTTGRGFCQGDSGGPLVCRETAVGVVSFNRNRNCNYNDEVPNVYANILKYLPWIHDVITYAK